MVIDFRIRPPYKGFMNLGIVRNWQSVPDDPRKMRPTGFERLPVPSMEHASVDMLVDEMKAAGITKGVLHGRHTGNARYGDVSNAEVNELLLRYPGLFVALAGISPNAPGCRGRARLSAMCSGTSVFHVGWTACSSSKPSTMALVIL